MATATNAQIREHMEVVGTDGVRVGIVDHMDGGRIKLTKLDSVENKHHFIPMSMVASVDDKVHLSMTFDDVTRQWETE